MKFFMYSIFDEKARQYTEPFCSANDATALRVFTNQVNHNDLLKDNKADFELYRVGGFDNTTGEIVDGRQLLASGKDVMINE